MQSLTLRAILHLFCKYVYLSLCLFFVLFSFQPFFFCFLFSSLFIFIAGCHDAAASFSSLPLSTAERAILRSLSGSFFFFAVVVGTATTCTSITTTATSAALLFFRFSFLSFFRRRRLRLVSLQRHATAISVWRGVVDAVGRRCVVV